MRAYVKSAGRKDSQDYVWIPAGAAGAIPPADAELLSLAERSSARQGRVATFSGEAGEPPHLFALFFGNVNSGRTDFYGTPILNRAGFVFDAADESDVRAALNLASDWYSAKSRLEGLLATGIEASDGERGFAAPGFEEAVAGIAAAPPDANRGPGAGMALSPDADMGLFNSIRLIAGIAGKIRDGAGARATPEFKATPDTKREGNPSMKIFMNTVPSGELDYGWYVGGRPPYEKRLWDVCERVRSVSAETAFFASLAREPNAWVVFAQDIVGRDEFTMRPARGTVAIEVSDSEPDAQAKARRLLREWLLPEGKLLDAIRRHVDVSGEQVKADMPALLAEVARIAADDSGIAILRCPLEGGRILQRIAKDRSNFDSLRRDAAQFVNDREFPDEPGVQFLFTNTPYSENPRSLDVLPQIPAKFIVLGWREDPPALRDAPGGGAGGSGARPDRPGPLSSFSRGVVAVAAFAALAIVALFARGCGGCGKKPPPPPTGEETNSPSVTNSNDAVQAQ